MKKHLMKLFSSALTLILVFSMVLGSLGLAYAATGKVTYDGNAEEFIFAPGSECSPTDLFPGFKDVMPGDSLTQKITVKNDASKEVKVKIYMRVVGAHADSNQFLSQMHLSAAAAGDGKADYLFDAAASKKAQMKDWVLLGTLYSGGKVNLNVTLDVPVEMDNSWMEQIGYLDWQFKVEEFPIEKDDPKLPKTGDDSNPILWLLVMAVSAAVLVMLLGKKWRDRRV